MDVRLQAIAVCIFAPMTSAHPVQPPIDAAGVLHGIERSYAFTTTYEVFVESFALGSAESGEADIPDRLRELKGERLKPFIISCHPKLGDLVDKTDPFQRRAAMSPHGELFREDGYYTINNAGGECQKTSIAQPYVSRGMSAKYVPTSIGYWVRWKASQGPPRLVMSDHRVVQIELSNTVFDIDPGDYTVLGWSSVESGFESRVKFVEWQSSEVMKARFPKLAYSSTGRVGEKPFVVVVEFGRPSVRPIPDEQFVWWTYADTARDMATGEVYGPGDVKLVVAPSAKRVPASSNAMKLDKSSVEANSRDPLMPILPQTSGGLTVGLRVVGVVSVLIGIAWAIRKRMGMQ